MWPYFYLQLYTNTRFEPNAYSLKEKAAQHFNLDLEFEWIKLQNLKLGTALL